LPDAPAATRRAALISVFDKTGSADLARALERRGIEIYATGGTRAFLQHQGVRARDVEDVTGFPALFGGRVKTLHPKIFGAILFDRTDREHKSQAEKYAIAEICVVVVISIPLKRRSRARVRRKKKRSSRSISGRGIVTSCGQKLRARRRPNASFTVCRISSRDRVG